jgi:hypothetical protein
MGAGVCVTQIPYDVGEETRVDKPDDPARSSAPFVAVDQRTVRLADSNILVALGSHGALRPEVTQALATM